MGTSVAMASAETELYRRAAAYEMHGERVDGNDVVAVREASARLYASARNERRPAVLETMTYRWRGHSVADAGKVYRTPDEIADWRGRDPIARFVADATAAGGLADGDVEAVRREIEGVVSDAIREAASAAAPDPVHLYDNVYGDPGTPDQFARMDVAAPFGEGEETRAWRT